MHTFQDLVSKLVDFWAKKGCIIHQGHDVEVGAGTFNPATFFRCLGPEPFSTVYVEPSRRPQDGRYGENPNRLQLFHQLQVIIKPSPLDAQKLYLESLEAVGFDLSKHDIRFVHDDWESPTLGAWGLGWEVWIDGMEITQFTYFQAVASMSLKPITVELTYGLERLAMILQGKKSLFEMQWNETYTYEDVVKQNEVEWSTYNFEKATPEMWLRHFDDHEREAKKLIEEGLPIPAYDFVLKGSHDFNMLEARGVLSVTERAGYIARVRDLARAVAEAYVERREAAGYPLLRHIEKTELPKVSLPDTSFDASRVDDFVLEIGSEELPAGYVQRACADLKRLLIDVLSSNELPFDQVDVHGTPRRLTAYVHGLAHGSQDTKEERRGPPVSIAFDDSGMVTKQGQGFFKSIGKDAASLADVRAGKTDGVSLQEVKGSEYLFAVLEKKGQSAARVLSDALPHVIEGISFPKKMRWADLSLEYARPLTWVVALHGETIVPFAIGSIAASRISYGHFQRDDTPIELSCATSYFETLKKHAVLVKTSERAKRISEMLVAIEKKMDCTVVEQDKVLKEVLFLSEYPELICAEFDEAFLEAPKEVLISEMVEHQRYFPLAKADGTLLNNFVITADNTESSAIVEGNRRVLSARLSDGVFLCKQDLKHPLTHFAEKLRAVIFQKSLGTMQEKATRIESIALLVNEKLALTSAQTVKEAAYLCKADLTTELVGEFPELQGMVGRYYAEQQGLSTDVAQAIEEHWMPRSEKSTLPQTEAGIVLSIADRIDNLCSYFSVGLKPTSSSDPFALRRATLGLLRILIEHELSLDVEEIVKAQVDEDVADEVMQFILTRAKTVFLEYGLSKDEIEASLAECVNPFDQYLRVQALHGFRQTDSFAQLFEVYKRAKGQLANRKKETLVEAILEAQAEKDLLSSIKEMDPRYVKAIKEHKYSDAYSELATLQKPLAQLFEQVKILDDDEKVQKNRIALLQEVFTRFNALLDFSKLKG